MKEKNELSEINAFKSFAKCCELRISLDFIEKKYPPKPDIQCDVIDNGPHAFELVRVIDRNFAHLLKKNKETITNLYAYLSTLPKIKENNFNELYQNALISISFPEKLTLHERKQLFPIIFDHLLKFNGQFEGETCISGNGVLNLIIKISRIRDTNLRFRINHAAFFQDPVITALESKFNKRYETQYPVHLLAYIDNTPMIPEDMWRPSVEEFMKVSFHSSQFMKVWIFDFINNAILMEYS